MFRREEGELTGIQELMPVDADPSVFVALLRLPCSGLPLRTAQTVGEIHFCMRVCSMPQSPESLIVRKSWKS